MEFLVITASSTMSEEIETAFKKNAIVGYTLFPVVFGSGFGGGKRLNDEIWPGQNVVYFAAVSEDQCQALFDWVKEYRKHKIREGLKIFNLALKEMV